MAAAPRGHPALPASQKLRDSTFDGAGVETCSPLGAVLGPDRPGDPDRAGCRDEPGESVTFAKLGVGEGGVEGQTPRGTPQLA
jgi:hypothetical protein